MLHLIYYLCWTRLGIKIVVLDIDTDSIIEKVRVKNLEVI